ncbi:hypothetical protein FHL15_000475 [Xylaria flabelliformis]|uniref:Uncharacterized protein n=1 Tax=Xylaria flabelliformis TaxID=2512241 RepID=A0A553IDY4_9PEZI|nr:hypothetical protein FHL15_000475 [Xylaria flabelliformis]
MGSRNNGDIRGFFKSAGPSKSQPQKQPASSSLSELPSSPRTPPRSAPRVFSRDEEIKGSDDSDDDSDDSLGSITDALGYRSRPAAHRRDPNVLSTPQAKRIASASGIHRSPLTLQPKTHKFDLKALINHSREIERTEESVRKADAMIAHTGHNSDNTDDSDAENDPKRLEEVTCRLFVGSDDEDGKGDKIRRAFKRSKDDDTSSRKHCYFFNQEEPPPKPGKNAFPRKKATGRWKCLSQADARRRAFMMGLPHTFIARGETLPDELFLWILDEICREQNAELRRQYINLTELCDDNTSRLVDDVRLYALLQGIGGPEYTRESTKFKGTRDVRHEYLERNWSPLVEFLQLLDRIAPALQAMSAAGAVQLLLRMSMDPVVAAVVREHYTRAITTIDDLELKLTVILSIPSSSTHLVDLRRRIAAESLFNKPGLGSKPIDPYLSFERIRDRLDEDDFKSTNRVDFDYERLRALTTLLDIVIDRADFMRPTTTTTNGTSAISEGDLPNPEDAAAEQKFNAEVDLLAARVKVIHDRIRDKASRKNVKLSLLGLEKRLKYAVRTRPPPRREIFALEGSSARTESSALNVPKQRDFMRQWAQKKKAEKQDKEDSVTDAPEFTNGGRQRRAPKGLPLAVG